MKEKFMRFMQGRYGNDEFSRFLSWLGLALILISLIGSLLGSGFVSTLFWALALAAIVFSLIRSFSKDIYKRQGENKKYLELRNRVKSWFSTLKQRMKDGKEFKYFKCPQCKAALRVPRHKGNVRITCKKCGNQFMGKT
jgi:ribosomal protein S27E